MEPQPDRPATGTATTNGWRILVVDDEPDMLENVVRILRRTPHRCITAETGAVALLLVDTEQPDLVLTDLRLPGMDGLALLGAIKRLSPPTPVVIFTAYASESVEKEAVRAGAAGFLVKPFTAAGLLQVIAQALGPGSGPPP